jgi:DNA-binding SARP family transcriptional activator
MSHLRIQLFGRFCLSCNGQEISGMEGGKARELLAYLLVHHDHPQTRETLAELLWSSCQEGQSKKYLRQTLWQIQAALRNLPEFDLEDFFQIDTHWMQVHLNSQVNLDVAIFEDAAAFLKQWRGQPLNETQASVLRQAADLYQGDLFEGCYRSWCVLERERMQCQYLLMLDRLMAHAEATQEYGTGLAYGLRILHFDHARERTHRQMMKLHFLSGDRTGALRQYQHCVEALVQELGVKPSRLTVELCQQIKEDRLTLSPDEQPPTVDETASLMPALLHKSFEEIQTLLNGLQQQVQQEIRNLAAGPKNRS